jgi:hypothetical protein
LTTDLSNNKWPVTKLVLGLTLAIGFVAFGLRQVPRLTPADIAPQPNLVTEARARRLTSNLPDLDVSDLVAKYIRVGSSREHISRDLARLGFYINSNIERSGEREFLVAGLYPLNEYWLNLQPSANELRVVIELKNETVVGVRGRLITRGI